MKHFLLFFFLFILFSCEQKKQQKPDNPVATGGKTDINNASVSDWMSWEGGIDVVGVTDTALKNPNVIFHIARMVHTPVGSAPSGMLFYQPDTTKPPVIMGFISTDTTVGKYFGPKIFKGTPFENAPVLKATFDVKHENASATAKVTAGGHTFECSMNDLGNAYLISRLPSQMPPFFQQGVERKADKVMLKIDGQEIKLFIPPVGISGGPAAVVAPNGVYAR
ncbi:MAG: hypothetical protein N2747_11240 [Chitinophagaceae bacterium]|nr:hypothetical protein [Chitinophagaceae bacterium]